jgi:hypothetical protein
LGVGTLVFFTQRATPLTEEKQGAVCCQQVRWISPNLTVLVLIMKHDGAQTKRWRRDFVLALERRRAKRKFRLTPHCHVHSYLLVTHQKVRNSCQKVD